MYCRNCGKELPDNSNFCPECGVRQNEKSNNEIHVPKFIMEHKKLSYSYIIWFLLHIALFISSSKSGSEGFYPWDRPLNYMLTHFWEGEKFNYSFSLFDKYDVYDFSEFFFYTIIFPIIIFGAFKLHPYVLVYLKRAKERYIQWKETNVKEDEHSEILSEENQEKTNDVTSFRLGWTEQPFNQDKEVSNKDDEVDSSCSTLQTYENAINSIDPSGGTGCMTIAAILGCTFLIEFIVSIIPYSYLPVLPKALIQMAIGCVGVYFVHSYLNANEDKEVIQEEYTYSEMPLYQRILGSFIDKYIIYFLFIILSVIAHPYQAPGDLGTYNAILLGGIPSNYEAIDEIHIAQGYGYSNLYGDTPYIGQTMDLDIGMTTTLVIVYLLYHLIFETAINASPCKKLFKGVLLRENEEKMRMKDILYRMLIRGAIFLVAIYSIHIWMECAYLFVFIALLLFVDIPLFFSHRSTIDILSGTMYMKRVKDDSSSEELYNEINIVHDTNSDIKSNKDNTIIYEEVVKDEAADNIEGENEDSDEDGIENHTKNKIFVFILASILFVGSIAIWQYWSDIVKYITDDSTVSPPKDRMCPELIEFEKEFKAKVPFTLVDGIKIVDVIYKDTTFTSFYQMDSDIVPFDKMSAFPEDHKRGALANIEVSTGKTREYYKKMVEYHVANVDKYIDKKTGKSVTITISPKEIDTALREPQSALGRLEQYIDTQKKMLPYEEAKGFTHTNIEIEEGKVIAEICVDEDLYDFHDLIEMKDELRANLINHLLTESVSNKFCLLLGEAHYGLTYRCYGDQSYLELFITLEADEIINLLEE